ncbi:adenosylmethionine--8-amino-7-oxononanoate transaminase [Fundidesulfovibrio soli]|uniref:adenosylmethionine--8-amino-7-oxononanoate transaminase n=1 Tax=Fundidesulfovibrio soli TaxID=2922716 RepID=UPI001FB04825|nr:adenosylmethionine--8-amino-7-oxononanoate transaminase [Fundidesulfovibrio soli]
MKGYFVTGTDTDAGKTVLSALLCMALEADYFKPFQTGQSGQPGVDSDTATVARLANLGPDRLHPPAVNLPDPLSPAQAAARAGITLDIAAVALPETPRPLVVEGAGGALVPIAPGQDMAALMARLGLPVIVAARSGLGTVNHTLLTLEALRLRGLEVAGVALSGPPNPENRRDIERLGNVPVIVEIPRLDPLDHDSLKALLPALALPGAASDVTSDVIRWDREHVWHPFTQAKTAPVPIHLSRASGADLVAADGRRFVDLVSSWWVCAHGHAHPEVARAVARQAATLEQALFAEFTHEPAARLAHRLAELLPGDLERVFYSDNGSTAVEVALKMAHQYWRNQGRLERTRIAAFEGAYHGDTVGAMSVGRTSGFFTHFEPLTFGVDFLPYPSTWIADPEGDRKLAQALAVLENYFSVHHGTVAAVILEPLVQGASGMRMAPPAFVKAVAEMARKAGALVILDEVMTGFGRTGTMFACEQAQAQPDIVCLAKGLTAGFLPMAATVASNAVYEGFLGETFHRALAHGHSFTANPLGCAAALAGLELFGREDTLGRIARQQAVHRERLEDLLEHPKLVRHRALGCIGAVDVTGRGEGYDVDTGRRLKAFYMERGFFVRPMGDVFYFLPPSSVTPQQLHDAYDLLPQALEQCL